jgi:hypothetical protein
MDLETIILLLGGGAIAFLAVKNVKKPRMRVDHPGAKWPEPKIEEPVHYGYDPANDTVPYGTLARALQVLGVKIMYDGKEWVFVESGIDGRIAHLDKVDQVIGVTDYGRLYWRSNNSTVNTSSLSVMKDIKQTLMYGKN